MAHNGEQLEEAEATQQKFTASEKRNQELQAKLEEMTREKDQQVRQ